MANSAVFLDRDGTLNVDTGYVYRAEDWEWIPGAIDAIALLKRAGFLVILVTNQAGIARGLYEERDLARLHARVSADVTASGASIDGFYHCPHHPDFGTKEKCKCRKPLPGMIHQASSEFDIDLKRSWLVGDKASDIQAGLAAGVSPILVGTGYGREHRPQVGNAVPYVKDVWHACSLILSKRFA